MVCGWTTAGRAQSSDAGKTTGEAAKTVKPKTANPKKHHQAAAEAAGTTGEAAKKTAHPASHPEAGTHPKSNTSKAKHPATRKHKRTARGQQKIDSERAQEIQEALIREHYMTGAASGKWSQVSEDAMRHYQADHGWQTKTVPDSRALISLGLGPSKDHLLNPESAQTTGPEAPRSMSTPATTPQSVPAAPAKTADPTPAANPNPGDGSKPQ